MILHNKTINRLLSVEFEVKGSARSQSSICFTSFAPSCPPMEKDLFHLRVLPWIPFKFLGRHHDLNSSDQLEQDHWSSLYYLSSTVSSFISFYPLKNRIKRKDFVKFFTLETWNGKGDFFMKRKKRKCSDTQKLHTRIWTEFRKKTYRNFPLLPKVKDALPRIHFFLVALISARHTLKSEVRIIKIPWLKMIIW